MRETLRTRQDLAPCTSSSTIELLGARFLFYSRRIRTLTINSKKRRTVRDSESDIKCQVSSQVVSLWTRHGPRKLFPRLKRLVVHSPPVGCPWDIQVVLDLINEMQGLVDLSVDIHDVDTFYGQDFRMSAPISGRLVLSASIADSFSRAAFLNTILTSSPSLQKVFLQDYITIDGMMQLAFLPNLTQLAVWGCCPLAPIPLLAPGAFENLTTLSFREVGVHRSITLFNIFLAMPPNKTLLRLVYRREAQEWDDPEFPDPSELNRFMERAALWTTLTDLSFVTSGVEDKHYMSIEESRLFFLQIHALPALTQLWIQCYVCFPITTDIIKVLLDACSVLERWRMTFDARGSDRDYTGVVAARIAFVSDGDEDYVGAEDVVAAPVAFSELLALIRGRRVRVLPVCLRCDTLPSFQEALGMAPLSLVGIVVRDIGDPAALGKVLFKMCPNLAWVRPESSNDPEGVDKVGQVWETLEALWSGDD
jgi:hypothetical protein